MLKKYCRIFAYNFVLMKHVELSIKQVSLNVISLQKKLRLRTVIYDILECKGKRDTSFSKHILDEIATYIII